MAESKTTIAPGNFPLLDFIPDGVIVVDADGTIVLVNTQAERIFGYSRNELIGQPHEVLVPERFRTAHNAEQTSYSNDPRIRPMGTGLKLSGQRKDGTEFPADISLGAFVLEGKRMAVSAIRDVSERTRLERIREAFISDAAHELRTPVTTLVGLSELLALHLPEMSETQVGQTLTALKRQGERVGMLISNLLDLSRLEGGRESFDVGWVEVAGAIGDAIGGAPAETGTSIEVVVEPGIAVLVDPARFRQVLTNLLVNAYRYGGKHIRIDANRDAFGVVVAISDDGSGVPADMIPKVFDPFTRGMTAGALGGSGIGLAICRRLVEAFGGKIWYEAAVPEGARFVMHLPSA